MGPFLENVRFTIADTDEMKNAVFHLRYQVYAEECGFEPENEDKIERDIHDAHSVHIAALERFEDGRDEMIGTIRLVKHSSEGFPIEKAPVPLDFRDATGGGMPPPETTVEISRFAVAKRYRRRQSDGLFGVESYLRIKGDDITWDPGPNRKRPFVVLGLYKQVYQYTKRHNITHWYMFTERALCAAVAKFGYLFRPIGDPVLYHGRKRIPYLGILDEIDRNLYENKRDYFFELMEGLEPRFHPSF